MYFEYLNLKRWFSDMEKIKDLLKCKHCWNSSFLYLKFNNYLFWRLSLGNPFFIIFYQISIMDWKIYFFLTQPDIYTIDEAEM